jgi:arginine/ornithine transport system permease protein
MTTLDALLLDYPAYLHGLWLTLQLATIPLVVGLAGAIPLAVLRIAPSRLLSLPVATFTYFMRGTPMLAQLMIVYYGLGQFEWMQRAWQNGSPLLLLLRDPYYCALLAFTLNTCAYTTEILAGALRATPYGEVEAAQAFGMSRVTAWRRILLPSAMRRFIPAYSNEVILLLHGTSIASAVTLVDLTGAARDFYANYYAPFAAFLLAGAMYFCLTMAIAVVVRRAEKKYLAYFQPRQTPHAKGR